MVQIIRANQCIFTLDLSTADRKSDALSASWVAATLDTFTVKLPGIPPAANVSLTSGGSEVAFTNASSIITVTVSIAKANLTNLGQNQSITVERTPNGGTMIAFEYVGVLNVNSESNP